MSKRFEEPSINIDVFAVEDVITASICVTDCGNVTESGGGI